MPQNVCLLGATGSIGLNTLDVIKDHSDKFTVHSLVAHQNVDKMLEIAAQCLPKIIILTNKEACERFKIRYAGTATVSHDMRTVVDCVTHDDVDIVLSAIVGAAGLVPTLAAASAGKKILLANKESLVVAGHLLMQTALECGALLMPVDSEHNALLQTLPESWRIGTRCDVIRRVFLTASGGPFWAQPELDLNTVTPEMACAHPRWKMGRKISVDSATMMNKGLEVIEAKWLFDLSPSQIEVLVHPQSTVHAMAEYKDGSVLAHLSSTDMRLPIAHALGYPERLTSSAPTIDMMALGQLNFAPPDEERFPCFKLAKQALKSSQDKVIALNAANEIAVEAFLNQKLSFADINNIVSDTLARVSGAVSSLEAILELDAQARRIATQMIGD